jgi:hypothetical protein
MNALRRSQAAAGARSQIVRRQVDFVFSDFLLAFARRRRANQDRRRGSAKSGHPVRGPFGFENGGSMAAKNPDVRIGRLIAHQRVFERGASLDEVIGQEPKLPTLGEFGSLLIERAIVEVKNGLTLHLCAVQRLDQVALGDRFAIGSLQEKKTMGWPSGLRTGTGSAEADRVGKNGNQCE